MWRNVRGFIAAAAAIAAFALVMWVPMSEGVADPLTIGLFTAAALCAAYCAGFIVATIGDD